VSTYSGLRKWKSFAETDIFLTDLLRVCAMADRAERRFYEFGRFRLDLIDRVLLRDGEAIPLPPKAADTLVFLVQNAGSVVEKQRLLKQVWKDAFVEEGSLTRTISILRKALGDSVHEQEFISTIPTRGYRFATRVAGVSTIAALSHPSRIMLAVLPFENLSNNKSQEYFSDGLTEEMITQLGRMNPERLGVIARTSAMQYKSTTKKLRQIGRELNVSHILEGSFRRVGGRVRIAAQLIQVSDQTHVWAESYERGVSGILALQNDVAQAIARQIRIKLIPQERARLTALRSISPEAYEACLKGRYLWNQRTLRSLQKSIQYFEKAIHIDPACASAYAGLADSYLMMQDDGYLPTPEATVEAKRTAREALRIDDTLAEPHISLAHAYFHEFNWPAAESEFKRGLELNPNYAIAHFYYANYLFVMEQFRKALTEAQRSQTLDPKSLSAGSATAMAFYYGGQHDQAIQASLQALETDPKFAHSYEDLGRAYGEKRMWREALAAFKKAVTHSGRGSRYLASLAYGYAVSGRRKQAMTLMREVRELHERKYVSPYGLALIETGMGNKDKAFTWLDRAYQERAGALPFVKVDPRLAPLRSDPRFHSLLRRLGLGS